MRFEVTQAFTAPAEQVIALYTSTGMYESLPDFDKISRPEVLDHQADDERVVMKLRYSFIADLPAAALAVIDSDKLTWIETTTYDLAARTATVEFAPDHYASKMTATATVEFASVDEGSTREIFGDLRVRIMLVGGQVERTIVSGLREHLTAESEAVNAMLVAR